MLVVEITSPKSHFADLKQKSEFYRNLGIGAYLAIDAITPGSKLRRRIELHLWRLVDGEPQEILPDEDDGFALLEMGVRVFAEGQRIRFFSLATGAELKDSSELLAALEAERPEREAERQARLAEQKARLQAEAELDRLRAELRNLQGKE